MPRKRQWHRRSRGFGHARKARRGIAEWLVEKLAEDVPTLVGIDHGFSFPLRYFEVHGLLPDWPSFLDDFQHHWPTDEDHTYVDCVRDGLRGNGAARCGDAHWRRLTEKRAGGAKSVFQFDDTPTLPRQPSPAVISFFMALLSFADSAPRA